MGRYGKCWSCLLRDSKSGVCKIKHHFVALHKTCSEGEAWISNDKKEQETDGD